VRAARHVGGAARSGRRPRLRGGGERADRGVQRDPKQGVYWTIPIRNRGFNRKYWSRLLIAIRFRGFLQRCVMVFSEKCQVAGAAAGASPQASPSPATYATVGRNRGLSTGATLAACPQGHQPTMDIGQGQEEESG
jgi:hypothetical protein